MKFNSNSLTAVEEPASLHTSALRSASAKVGLLRCALQSSWRTASPSLNFGRVRLVIVRVTSFFGVPHLPKRLRPAASTAVADVDSLVHLHELQVQVLSSRPLDALVDGLAICMPVLVHKRWSPSAGSHICGVDERAQRACFTFSKRYLVHLFPDGRVQVDLLGHTTMIACQFFFKSPIFTAS